MMKLDSVEKAAIGSVIFVAMWLITMVAGFITHCFALFNAFQVGTIDTIGSAAFWIITTIVVPLGTLHGIWLWFT